MKLRYSFINALMEIIFLLSYININNVHTENLQTYQQSSHGFSYHSSSNYLSIFLVVYLLAAIFLINKSNKVIPTLKIIGFIIFLDLVAYDWDSNNITFGIIENLPANYLSYMATIYFLISVIMTVFIISEVTFIYQHYRNKGKSK